MNAKSGVIAALIAVLALVTACSGAGSDSMLAGDGLQPTQSPAVAPVASELIPGGHTSSGFELGILPDSFLGAAPAGEFTLSEQPDGDFVLVTVRVTGADNLRAVYGKLRYDPRRYSPISVEQTPLVTDTGAEQATEQLALSNTATPGVVDFGQVLANCDVTAGLSGDAEVATVRFAGMAFSGDRQTSNSAITSDAVAVTIDPFIGEQRLTWEYLLPGDYNQDGEVGVADLTLIGQHYNRMGSRINDYSDDEGNVLDPEYAFEEGCIWDIVDGNQDGYINFADSTTIAVNYGNRIDGYRVFGSPSGVAGYPVGTALVEVTFSAGYLLEDFKPETTDRRYFDGSPPEFTEGWAYWVRPVMDDTPGTPSNWVVIDQDGLEGMSIERQPKSFYGGADYEAVSTVYYTTDKTYVDLGVLNAEKLRIFAVALSFSPELYEPEWLSAVSPPSSDCFEFPDDLCGYGQLYVTAWHEQGNFLGEGFSGDRHICRVTLATGRQDIKSDAFDVPSSTDSKTARALFNPTTQSLEWFHSLKGDCDQDGLVLLDDWNVYHIPEVWSQRVISTKSLIYFYDINSNLIMDVWDLLGTPWRTGIDGYNVYASMDADAVADESLEPIAWVDFKEAQGNRFLERLSFSCAIPGAANGMYLWIKPTLGAEVGGLPEGGLTRIPGAEDS